MATAVEFDFRDRTERSIEADRAATACADGRFCWIELDMDAEPEAAERMLRGLGVNEHAVREALSPAVEGRRDFYEDCLHLTITATGFAEGRLVLETVDLVLGAHFLVTLRRGPIHFIAQVRRHYSQDFVQFAQTPSFLLYEHWDHLIESYRHTLQDLEARVETFRAEIFREVDDGIFNRAADVTRDLLSFRKVLLEARDVLYELATRRSPFVAESSQPFLDRLVTPLERLGADVTIERETLAETLNLYMGMVSHRTNRVVNRLTVISMVFLPLTFLCGVYGMNFEHMPELRWAQGYAFFWVLAVLIGAGLLAFMKRRKWW
jgi:magnesium transporter